MIALLDNGFIGRLSAESRGSKIGDKVKAVTGNKSEQGLFVARLKYPYTKDSIHKNQPLYY